MKALFTCLIATMAFVCTARPPQNYSSNYLVSSGDIKYSTPPIQHYPGPYGSRGGGECVNAMTVTSWVIGAAGGACVGYTLGTLIGGGEPDYIIGGVGLGLIAIAIPLEIAGKNRCGGRYGALNATPEYAARKSSAQLHLVATGNSVGIRLNF